ncbi:MAG: nucleotide-binding protein [FCB group bacterium]|nr:nucleotide-binding protein [FCB group bacterium]
MNLDPLEKEILLAIYRDDCQAYQIGRTTRTIIRTKNHKAEFSNHDAKLAFDALGELGLVANLSGALWQLTRDGRQLAKALTDEVPVAISESALVQVGDTDAPIPVATDRRMVFVVHGRNSRLRASMFDFLRAIGLHPLEWSQALGLTKDASPYIGDILEAAFSNAQAVLVLLSGDDEARLLPHFYKYNESSDETEFRPQCRPNVLFEAGMAMARAPKRTVLVQVGEVKHFSDVAGKHILHLDNTSERRNDLCNRLKLAGCEVDTTGSDWLNVGDFSSNGQEMSAARSDSTHAHRPAAKATPSTAEAKLSAEEIEIVSAIARLPENDSIGAESLARHLGEDALKTRYLLEKLLKEGMLIDRLVMGEPKSYLLSSRGMNYLVEEGQV